MTIDVHGAARIDPMQLRNCVPMGEVTHVDNGGRDCCPDHTNRAECGIDANLSGMGMLVLDPPQ